jgi:hypothetical protein
MATLSSRRQPAVTGQNLSCVLGIRESGTTFASTNAWRPANNHADDDKTMGFIAATAKKAVFWTYPRTSWQWDVLCVLILVFIFLTPKGWFENSAFQRTHMGQTTIVMKTDVVGSQLDRSELERRVRLLPGRAGAQVSAVRELQESGKLIGYEVDIR